MPLWLETLLVFGLALALAWAAAKLIHRAIMRMLVRGNEFWVPLVTRTRRPFQLALTLLALNFAASHIALPYAGVRFLQHLLIIGFIACVSWMLKAALDIWMALHMKRYRIDVEDNLLARKHLTQSRILQRVGTVMIVVVGFGAALMTIEGVRQYGVSLLASAGVAGIVVGLALQSVLRNLLAGIQIALTQPIRIDDAVIVEGEWGNVEEITATYVVVRIWDKRRLVVPLNYFMEQPFQNWTRKEAALLGAVMIYVDHEVSIPDLRAAAERIVKAHPNWTGEVFVLQVTHFREREVEVRVLASADNAGDAFDLRCAIREGLLAYLQDDQPRALPKTRADVVAMPGARGRGSDRRQNPDARPEPSAPRLVHSGITDRPPGQFAKETSMAKAKTLDDLFLDTLKDIYYAERKILKALPKMQRAASSEKLAQAFAHHKEETETQIERLQQVFEMLGKAPRGKTCDAIEGIIAEGEEIMEEFKGTPALDAGLVSAAQAVEHYEIARYGTLRRWAKDLGMNDAAKLLEETLKEESSTDEKLTMMAEKEANPAAVNA
jgi:ferritin-like metal-binding protein YciE/small-conductance mechanosensitive channel